MFMSNASSISKIISTKLAELISKSLIKSAVSVKFSKARLLFTEGLIIAFNFETAWAPPVEAFNEITKRYPNILFCLYYEEPGMGFCGRNVWGSGEQQEEMQTDLVSKWFEEDWLYDQYITDVQQENTTKETE